MTRNPTLAVVVLALLASAPVVQGQDRDAPPDAGRMVVRNPVAPSRELSMRPLPAYRIGPPDILQIEIIPKGEGTARHQPSSCINQGELSAAAEGDSPIFAAQKSGQSPSSFSADAKTGVGVLTLRGENIYTGTTTITDMGGLPNASVGTLKISGNICPNDEAKNYGVVFSSDSNPDSGTSVGWTAEGAGPTGGQKIEKSGSITVQDQPVSGQYLVGPDGTINLRQYGLVQVTGKTIPEVRMTLEKHLAKSLGAPQVSVEVLAYNSKVYYVITDGGGMGDNVRRLPLCGNETVLDAIAAVGGLSQLSGKKMWIARPSSSNPQKGTILPIDYLAITRLGATATNYQILPGDRIFIEADGTIALSNILSKKTAPIERALGLLSLTSSAMKMQGRKNHASSDQETVRRHRRKAPRPEEIEAELTNAIYRCLQRMIPMLDALGGGGKKPCESEK